MDFRPVKVGAKKGWYAGHYGLSGRELRESQKLSGLWLI